MNGDLSPDQLGRELRTGSGPFLKQRRNILGLSLFSSAVLGGIALYQMGILKKLPEPRAGFKAEKFTVPLKPIPPWKSQTPYSVSRATQ
jgi:hypothetical protein